MLAVLLSVIALAMELSESVRVRTSAELQTALSAAKPGTVILVAPGDYRGGIHVSGVSGTAVRPIVVVSESASKPAKFVGGGNAIQLSGCSWVTLRNLVASGQTGNGFNIDDGVKKKPSVGIILEKIAVSDLPAGNHDGIKLSGLTDFVVSNCLVERWGGSAVDMVGCRSGVIQDSVFRDGGDSGVQAKGGSKDISVTRCRFENFGQRGVNLGGSTGLAYFRPPVDQVPAGKRFEAQNVWVQGSTFIGGVSPIAFVGVEGATVRFNTIYHPGRWAMRILQETTSPDFVPSRNGKFTDNLIVFQSEKWSSGGVNVGPGTDPKSFRFERNFWFCSDRPQFKQISLPTREIGGLVGTDPQLMNPSRGDLRVRQGSPAAKFGAHAFQG